MPARRVEASGADVRLNTEATPELIESLKPDALLLAVGARPVVPPIPGIGSEKVKGLEALHRADPDLGQRIAVLGGGLVGSESAVWLSMLGRDVTVVEIKDDYASEANEMHKIALEHEFKRYGIRTLLRTAALAVTEEGLLCSGPDGEFTVPCDSVLLAAGMRADWETVEKLRWSAPWYWAVGDCVRAGQVVNATEQGHNAVLDL